MDEIYLTSNFDPETINFTGYASMAFLVIGLIYSILTVIFTFKKQEKAAIIFKMSAITLYVCSIFLLILWATYVIVNQVNGMTELLSW